VCERVDTTTRELLSSRHDVAAASAGLTVARAASPGRRRRARDRPDPTKRAVGRSRRVHAVAIVSYHHGLIPLARPSRQATSISDGSSSVHVTRTDYFEGFPDWQPLP
jgi:hypothetical protein